MVLKIIKPNILVIDDDDAHRAAMVVMLEDEDYLELISYGIDRVLAKAKEEFNNIDYHDATFNVSEHTNEELVKYQRKLFLMFYLNFSRILRILTSPVIKKKYLFHYLMIFMRRVIFRKRES